MSALLLLLLSQSPLVTTTGSVDLRTTSAWTQFDGAPALTVLGEANAQIKLTPHEKVTFFADTSLFWQGAWQIQGGEKDLAQYRPSVVISEAYADLPLQDHFRLLVGKKRIVWGSGLSFNPTDMLNPAKDPTDPAFQRAGAWLAEAEWGFEKVAISAVAAGKVTRQYAGLPTALVISPQFASAESVRGIATDDRDDEAHFVFNGRLYLLLGELDVNLIYGYSNLYADAFRTKSRGGISLSKVFGDFEVHAEVLLYTGSARVVVNEDCVDLPARCLFRGVPVATRPYLDSEWLNARAIFGMRYQFGDNGMFAVEYYYNGEGQDPEGFRKLATLMAQNPGLAQQAILGSSSSADPGAPQKFSLEALRRHYVTIQYSQPQFVDDWSVSATALIGLEDLSMQLVPQIQWAPAEWLQLTAALYVPVAGLDELNVKVGEAHYGQFTLSPFETRVLVSARAFF
jgi:hypothetical protein